MWNGTAGEELTPVRVMYDWMSSSQEGERERVFESRSTIRSSLCHLRVGSWVQQLHFASVSDADDLLKHSDEKRGVSR